jgi:hypothetical protein
MLFNHMIDNFHVELIPRTTRNEYYNTWTVILKSECITRFYVKHMQSSNFMLISKKYA